MTTPVNITTTNGVCHIELNRPDHANSINIPLAKSLQEAATAAQTPEIKVILLSGAGLRFCAGGDVSSFVEAEQSTDYLHELATTADAAVQTLEQLDKPIVAAVHGSVAGAGLGVMLAADIIYAAPDTKFVFAYPAVGLTPDCGVSAALPAAMGLQRALAFALSGRPLSAEDARLQGLITSVEETPLASAQKTAALMAEVAPGALGKTRQLLRSSASKTRCAVGLDEAKTISESVVHPEAQQLISRFVGR
jgi:2-(1,2-epoxy-1,2-dihydrophenyl)acetyl-CoA isomerase